MHTYWENAVGMSGVPVLKSIATADYYTKDPNQVAIVEKWIPVCKTLAATGTQSFAALAAVDGGQALVQFTQTDAAGQDRRQGGPDHPAAGPRSGRQVTAPARLNRRRTDAIHRHIPRSRGRHDSRQFARTGRTVG